MKLIAVVVIALLDFGRCIIVDVPRLGLIQGSTTQSAWTNKTIYQFLSVRYAESPSGNRRFAPSEPYGPWNGVYDATTQGIRCPQISDLNNLYNQPEDKDMEDCLTLNIYTRFIPADLSRRRKLYPVVVHIHGGKFVGGGANDYRPNFLLEHDMILVVPQYRLGALGGLALHTDAIAGNMGLMDQLLALRWVNKYIKYFGGNFSAVTISGHSSGAFSVAAHLLSPIVKPYLFQKIIIKSGSPYSKWGVFKDPIGYARDLYRYMTNSTDKVDIRTMERAFINASLIDFVSANLRKFNSDSPFDAAGAVLQKAGKVKYLTEAPIEILRKGNHRSIPMMTGITKHDGSMFVQSQYDIVSGLNLQNDDNFLRNDIIRHTLESMNIYDNSDTVVNIVNNDYTKNLFRQNRRLNFTDLSPTLTDIFGIFTFKSQILKQAKINIKRVPETYLYTFDYRGQYTNFNNGNSSEYPFDGGVYHSDELLYLFYDPKRPLNEKDTCMAKVMVELYANFVIHSEPQSKLRNFRWPAIIEGENGPFLHIDSTPTIGYDFVETEFWAAVNEVNGKSEPY